MARRLTISSWRRWFGRGCACLFIHLVLLPAAPTRAAGQLPVEQFELANGMRFLLLERPGLPVIEAGWVVPSGSATDPAGASGISHFIEHMMFKGSRVIGASNIDRELALLAELDTIDASLAGDDLAGRQRQKRHRALEEQRQLLTAELDQLAQLGAFGLEYSRAGGTRLNANTAEDLTLYYVTLPAEKLELWFWLEADRLSQPVFRELEKEKSVVAEERRLRIDSTPTGAADRAFDALFWQGSPYAQPPLGVAEEVSSLQRSQLHEFFRRHYRADRLTAVLVGNFETSRVRALAESYFGPLQNPAPAPGADRTASTQPFRATVPQRPGTEPFQQQCDCPSQVRIRYPTVPFADDDQFALQALAGLLNGRGGRLYRRLVLGRELAFSAFAQQTPLRQAGSFTVILEAKGDVDLATLVKAWDAELALLTTTAPEAAELVRAQRRMATENLNQLKDPHALMRRLLVYAGLGDWRLLATWSERLAAVQPQQIVDVARRHLIAERRLVGYYRQAKDER